MNRKLILITLLCLLPALAHARKFNIRPSSNDIFQIEDHELWTVTPKDFPKENSIEVLITSVEEDLFEAKLFFMLDDQAKPQWKNPQAMQSTIKRFVEPEMKDSLEDSLKFEPLEVSKTKGTFTILTNNKLFPKYSIYGSNYQYFTCGMIRLTNDTVLCFMILSKDLKSKEYEAVFKYACQLVGGGKKLNG